MTTLRMEIFEELFPTFLLFNLDEVNYSTIPMIFCSSAVRFLLLTVNRKMTKFRIRESEGERVKHSFTLELTKREILVLLVCCEIRRKWRICIHIKSGIDWFLFAILFTWPSKVEFFKAS